MEISAVALALAQIVFWVRPHVWLVEDMSS